MLMITRVTTTVDDIWETSNQWSLEMQNSPAAEAEQSLCEAGL